jgi:transcription antitermination factor NusG
MNKTKETNDKKRKWYAIYTKPRNEKKVTEQLKNLSYEVYLPLKKEVRQWKDRLKKVEVPLFNSYVFVKITDREYYEIPKQIKGIVKFVTIGGKRIEVREEEIATIKRILSYSDENIDVKNENFDINDKVEIKYGSLKGLQGRLLKFKGKYKIAIEIQTIGTNLLVEIDKKFVKKLNTIKTK